MQCLRFIHYQQLVVIRYVFFHLYRISNRLLGNFIMSAQKLLANSHSFGHLDMRSTIDSPTP
jgi:hypothetical protein